MQPIFNYCPRCKSSNINFSQGNKALCTDCDFEYYHNTAGAVSVIIQKKSEILLTIRNKNPKKGLLDLAGGFIDPNETAEHACMRELQEELNITIDQSKLQYINSNPNTYLYKDVLYNVIDLFFLYKDEDLEINSFDTVELEGYIWKEINDIKLEDLAFDSQKNTLKYLLENKLLGTF